jgi:uncharacterized protein (TIGR02271 family)
MAQKDRTDSRDRNPDPITGAPGSHPVGTGVGAAGGGAAGAAIGSAVGPVGTVAGAVIGAVAGGLAGKGVAERIDPTAEEAYWRDNYKSRSYVQSGAKYDDYAPAYRYGWEARQQHAGKKFEEVEPHLATEWETRRGKSPLSWQNARHATREAWERIDTGGTAETRELREGEARVPVVEEEVRIGKREVERGGVRVRTEVSEKPVEEQVNLREEHVRVERRPVDRPATQADLNKAMTESNLEVTERAEEAVVQKNARVVEEVVLGKEQTERSETVRDTVRRTDVEVEKVNPSIEKTRTVKETERRP